MSSKIYGSSGRHADPLSNMGAFVGIVAAVIAAILWYYHFQPNSQILGEYSRRVADGDLHEQLRILSAVLGTMAVIAGTGASLGGRGRAASVIALVLGIAGLSYWVLTTLNVFTRVVPTPL